MASAQNENFRPQAGNEHGGDIASSLKDWAVVQPLVLQSGPPAQIPEAFSHLLEKYSGVEAKDQAALIEACRDEAYALHPYPCIGRYRFITLPLSRHPQYSSVLAKLMADKDSMLLELGSCFAQDLRKLMFDGVAPSQIYGSDLNADFVPVSYKLFKDSEKWPESQYIAPADGLKFTPENPLYKFAGRCDVVHASAIFHLFDYETQLCLARTVALLLKPKKGSFLIGVQGGNVESGSRKFCETSRTEHFLHNAESWAEMWGEVAKRLMCETGRTYKFRCETALKDLTEASLTSELGGMLREANPERRWMTFTVYFDQDVQ